MKKVVLLFVASLLIFSAYAQKVSIKTNYDCKMSLIVDGRSYTYTLAKDKVDSQTIEISKPTYADLKYGYNVYKLYLTPGKDLLLNFNYENKKVTRTAKCNDGGINKYLATVKYKSSISQKDQGLEESVFIKKIHSNIKKYQAKLKSAKLPSKFRKIEKENIYYSIMNNFAMHEGYYNWINKTAKYVASDAYYAELIKAMKEKKSVLNLDSYRIFIKTAISTMVDKKRDLNQLEKTISKAKYASSYKDENLRGYLVNDFTYSYISRSGVDGVEDLLTLFKANVKDEAMISEMDKSVSQWSKLKKGLPSPAFNLKDIDGRMVSLKSLRGKLVYVDCWATWCGPCCGELPHLKTLEHEYKDKDIFFVSMSCDRNEKQWRAKVEKEKLGGIQLIKDKSCTFMKEYIVKGIPRFILIDREGNILSADAPRPSSEKDIRALLDKEL